MIGRLRGLLLATEPDRVLVEVGSGVGYEVLVAPRVLMELPAVGAEVTLHIHTHVREDAITLYGFGTEPDRRVFRVVQSVSGIGPKLALALVGTVEPKTLADAIARDDIVGLTRIPGLGKKTAARLCLELKDKLGKLLPHPSLSASLDGATVTADPPAVEDATAALAALGYNAREIKKALAAADPTAEDTVQTLLRRALKALSPS
ncbi:MAG: Holliday junction branch migration protein RuvA [Proteobacteria bacterium]|nr:Holliday junction branch migration protein RuvA [Pseudomonadota bacterium]